MTLWVTEQMFNGHERINTVKDMVKERGGDVL